LLGKAGLEGVSFVVEFTPAVIASNGVDTDSILSAYFIGALIDVKTSNERISIEAFLAGTDFAGSICDTLGITSTLAVLYNINGRW